MTDYNDVRNALTEAVRVYSSELNVYHYVPRTLVPPSAIVKPRGTRTIDYQQMQGRSQLAKWYFNIMLVIGLVDEEAAQKLAGELISPGSPLITCLLAANVPNGFTQVTEGAVNNMMFGQALYTYAELMVTVIS